MKEKRDPSQHRTPSQIKARISGYEATPEQRKNRAKRNAARREMIDAGKARKGDGKDVDHERPIVKGGGNAMSNLSVESRKRNWPQSDQGGTCRTAARAAGAPAGNRVVRGLWRLHHVALAAAGRDPGAAADYVHLREAASSCPSGRWS